MGGPGFDTLTYALVMEELSRGYASVADQCGLVELISTLLVRHGTDGTARTLAGRCHGREDQGRLLHHRAGSGHGCLRHSHRSAVRDGDGWVLNGGKIWIHNAPVADLAFVLARTDKEAGHRGMSIFMRWTCMPTASSAGRRNTRWASARARWVR